MTKSQDDLELNAEFNTSPEYVKDLNVYYDDIFRDLVRWLDSPEVQNAFVMQGLRYPGSISKEFSDAAGVLWNKVRILANK